MVHVDVKPEAYEQRAFDRVLERNGITIEDSANDENKTSNCQVRIVEGCASQTFRRSSGADERAGVAEPLKLRPVVWNDN